jgi:hypothetical protein
MFISCSDQKLFPFNSETRHSYLGSRKKITSQKSKILSAIFDCKAQLDIFLELKILVLVTINGKFNS